ncbi:MAG: P-II family nitrogen regulator [Eubacteriales bacterium]
MKLITAIVRPQKVQAVTEALSDAGYNAYSKWSIFGRGRQKGIKVGEVVYEEMPKAMLYIAVEPKEKDEVIDIIIEAAKCGPNGSRGDGKIFVTDIDECYTISEQAYE